MVVIPLVWPVDGILTCRGTNPRVLTYCVNPYHNFFNISPEIPCMFKTYAISRRIGTTIFLIQTLFYYFLLLLYYFNFFLLHMYTRNSNTSTMCFSTDGNFLSSFLRVTRLRINGRIVIWSLGSFGSWTSVLTSKVILQLGLNEGMELFLTLVLSHIPFLPLVGTEGSTLLSTMSLERASFGLTDGTELTAAFVFFDSFSSCPYS